MEYFVILFELLKDHNFYFKNSSISNRMNEWYGNITFCDKKRYTCGLLSYCSSFS